MIKKISLSLLAVIILYIGSYIINSNAGGYWKRPESDGEHSLLGVELKTALLWQPRFGYHSNTRTDITGAIYLPLIWIDQKLFHKTLYITDFSTWGKSATTKFHPSSD